MNTDNANTVVWKMNTLGWVFVAGVLVLLGVLYYDGLVPLLSAWGGREEYSHGYLIPIISIFLLWLQKDRLEQLEFKGSWLGFVLVVLGIALFFMGELSTLYIIVQYSLLLVLAGFVLSFYGGYGLSFCFWFPWVTWFSAYLYRHFYIITCLANYS